MSSSILCVATFATCHDPICICSRCIGERKMVLLLKVMNGDECLHGQYYQPVLCFHVTNVTDQVQLGSIYST